jgi:hypothetical protein
MGAGAKIWGSRFPSLGEYWTPILVDYNGILQVGTPYIEVYSGTGVNVTTSSTLILAQNLYRRHALICNDSDTVIYLNLSVAAVMNQGIRLNANGGSYEINFTNLTSQAIYGIHGGTGNKVVTVIEGTTQ